MIVSPYLLAQQPRGRPWTHTRREILNAILYIIRSGCAWQLLPHDLPPWKTVFHYWRQWRLNGAWERLHQDQTAVPLLLEGTPTVFPTMEHVWVDQGYTGMGKHWITTNLSWTVTIIRHTWMPIGDLNDRANLRFEWTKIPCEQTGFRGVLPRRWVVERTLCPKGARSATTVG